MKKLLRKWLFPREEFVPKEEHDAFIKKADELLQERYEATDALERYAEWEENPMAVLAYFNPGLVIRHQNLEAMTKDEKELYLLEAHEIYNKSTFHSELNYQLKDLNDQLILTTESATKANMIRQLMIFIEGIKKRYESFAQQYEDLRRKKPRPEPGVPIPK